MTWKQHFDRLGDAIEREGRAGERIELWLQAEDSDFVRFNRGLVRQAGSVHAASLRVRLVLGRRHAATELTLSGDLAEDRRRAGEALDGLRATVPSLVDDPHLLLPDAPDSTEDDDGAAAPDAARATRDVLDAAREHGLDLVGLYAGGANHRAYRDNAGQRNWFTSHGQLFDWCLYVGGDKAVKQSVAGPRWDADAFARELAIGRRDLEALRRPARRIEPGTYRAFLTPAALHEMLEIVSWGGFSARAQQQRQSCLQRLVTGERALDPRVSLAENTGLGLSPRFTSDGFVVPARVPLVLEGRHAGSLVGPRSAAEQGLSCNAAEHESPASLEMAGGDLPMERAREALGTGVWVSQLWYCNHSDRNAGRLTGMTRFATMWVEGGEVVAPVEVMRFDDTIYDLLGSRLEALTEEAPLLPSTYSYGFRSTGGATVPGALVGGMRFTL